MREVEELFSIWKNSPNDEEKYLALECLGRVRNARLAKWVLGHAFSQDVKSQDVRKSHPQQPVAIIRL